MNAPHPTILDYPFTAPPAPASTLAVGPGIAWLRMPLPFALDHINLWLLAETEGFTLVDCGIGDEPTRTLWTRLLADFCGGRPIGRIVATHFHPDHLGNAAWLAAKFGCPVHMTQTEYLTAHAVRHGFASYTTDATCALFQAHGMADADAAALRARGNQYARGVPEVPGRFARMLAGDRLTLGGNAWLIIPGFGHAPEHASLYAAKLGILISGDMLLPRISTNVSVWPAEPDGDPLARFLASLDAFEALPADTLVLPSHGLPFRGIAARVAQLRAHHAARLAELETAIHDALGPMDAATLLPVLFRRELDLQQRYFAMGEAIAHLNHLWLAQRIRRNVDTAGNIRFCA